MASLPYRQDIEACTAHLDSAAWQHWQSRLPDAHALLQQQARELPILALPAMQDDIAEIEEIAAHLRRFKQLFVFGTGGSSLGGKTLVALKQRGFDVPQFPVQFVENVDPQTLHSLLDHVALEDAAFLAISKSGSTVETLSQSLLVLDILLTRCGPEGTRERMLCLTEPGPRPLRHLAEQHGLRVIDHHPNIGGRFSVLSNVGLIPAAAAGVDIRAVRNGAHAVLNDALSNVHSAPALGAAMQVAAMQNYPIHVTMPYCDRLESFTCWFQQLWAESIGKQGHGSTIVRALGTVDQHSQLQLYLDGPRNKCFTLMLPEFANDTLTIATGNVVGLEHLEGQRISTVMRAMQHGTLGTLKAHGCPVRVMRMPYLDEATLGALIMHGMLETMLSASLLEVNAFDQPAVEQSKQFAREYLHHHHPDAAKT